MHRGGWKLAQPHTAEGGKMMAASEIVFLLDVNSAQFYLASGW